IPSAESLRVPEEGSSAQGKSGPKARPKGVVEGQQVEIPVPLLRRYERWGDAGGQGRRRMEEPVQAARRVRRQIRAPGTLSRDGEGKFKYPKVLGSHCREKPLASRG